MGLIAAKCTNCGAKIEVDESKEAGICPHCGTAFITEKVINNYNVTNNYHIEKQVIYNEQKYDANGFEYTDKGELILYGYKEWYLIKPKVKIYKDGNYVGSVAYRDLIKINIEKDCVITLKCSFKEVKFHVKKNLKQVYRIAWNTLTGELLVLI